MEKPTIAATLGEFIERCSFKDLPEDVVASAKGRLLDSIACAIAGSQLPWSKIAVEVSRQPHGTGVLIGHAAKAPYADAAFVNGVQAHSILQEDTGGGGHPSTFVVPAVLAVADEYAANGREVLLATVLGYELCERISMGEEFMASMRKGFRGSLFGALGVAAAAGKLMKLPAVQQAHALGLAANFTSGLTQTWWSGSMDAVFAAGQTARVGITATVLARAGGTAAAEIFEGTHGFYQAYYGRTNRLESVTRDLGTDFAIKRAVEKPYPACAGTQIQIEMGLGFKHLNVSAADIVKVVETDGEWLVNSAGSNVGPPYTNMFQAQMSHQFCIAAALLDKPVTDYRFFAERHADPDVAALAAKVELVGESGRKWPVIEIHMRNGKRHVLQADQSHPRIGFIPSLKGDIDRLHTLAEPVIGRQQVLQIIDAVLQLDRGHGVGTLMQALTRLARSFEARSH